jgi:Accessory gene regulator B
MSYLAISKSLAGFLTEKASFTPEKEVVLTYAIEVLIINLGNILFTLILAMLLGVLPRRPHVRFRGISLKCPEEVVKEVVLPPLLLRIS